MCADFLKIKSRTDTSSPASTLCAENIKIKAAHAIGGKKAVDQVLRECVMMFV